MAGHYHQVSVSSGKVASFPWTEAAPVFDLSKEEIFATVKNDNGDETVIDEDSLSGCQNLKQFVC